MVMKEVTVKLPDNNYLRACREIINHWGYSDLEEFVEQEIRTLVETTLESNWDSLSKDLEESKRTARKIAKKYKIPIRGGVTDN